MPLNISLGESIVIVKHHLDDDTINYVKKAMAINRVAFMETHNSITKDDLIHALRWLYDNYFFGEDE